MDKEKELVVNIINRNYPPNPGITGESAAELAAFLSLNGCKVRIFHIDAPYAGSSRKSDAFGESIKIKTFYNGKSSVLRLMANLYEGFALLKRSVSYAADFTICMTDPPLLPMWIPVLMAKKKPWALWSMDLYPGAFVSSGLVRKTNVLFRLTEWLTHQRLPSFIIALGPCQAAFLKKKYKDNLETIELPCGIFSASEFSEEDSIPGWKIDNQKIYLGYCGNIGQAHSLPFLYKIIDNLDTQKFILILSLYGSYAKVMTDYARGKEGVVFASSLSRGDLKHIDIHLSSLKKEWVNVCVPSKTVSSVSAGSAFLHYGIEESDNWKMLQNAGWLIDSSKDLSTQVSEFLKAITPETLDSKKKAAVTVGDELNELKAVSFQKILTNIRLHSANLLN